MARRPSVHPLGSSLPGGTRALSSRAGPSPAGGCVSARHRPRPRAGTHDRSEVRPAGGRGWLAGCDAAIARTTARCSSSAVTAIANAIDARRIDCPPLIPLHPDLRPDGLHQGGDRWPTSARLLTRELGALDRCRSAPAYGVRLGPPERRLRQPLRPGADLLVAICGPLAGRGSVPDIQEQTGSFLLQIHRLTQGLEDWRWPHRIPVPQLRGGVFDWIAEHQ